MSFPTEAYMAAAANAAKIQADAQAQMGQAIGAGLQKAGAAVGDYMSQKADYEASSKIFDSPSFRQAMGLSEDDAKQQKTILKELVGEGGYKAANAYAKQQIDSLLNYAATTRAFEMQKELQRIKNEPMFSRDKSSGAGYNFVQEDSPFNVPRETGGGVVDDEYKDPMPWLPSRSAQPRNPGPYRY